MVAFRQPVEEPVDVVDSPAWLLGEELQRPLVGSHQCLNGRAVRWIPVRVHDDAHSGDREVIADPALCQVVEDQPGRRRIVLRNPS